jgi:hypothetical protein
MSRLYASIDSDSRKTQATSRGHRHISAHVRGWEVGVQVEAAIDNDSDEDVFAVYVTRGSAGGTMSAHHVARYASSTACPSSSANDLRGRGRLPRRHRGRVLRLRTASQTALAAAVRR